MNCESFMIIEDYTVPKPIYDRWNGDPALERVLLIFSQN